MGGRVLAIDDSMMVLAYIETILVAAGHHVVVSEDWASARAEFRTNESFHVILVDVNLPGMRSGDHLAKSLRMHPKAKDSKIVFFSAESGERLEQLTNMSGMDGYITKGQGDDKFLEDVESYMPLEVLDGTAVTPVTVTAPTSTVTPTPASPVPKKKSWWKR